MTAHIEWFNQMLTTALQLYFQQGCEYSSIEEVTPPDDGWLEEVTGRQDISFSERVVVMLALMPHTSPQSVPRHLLRPEQELRPPVHRVWRLERIVTRRFPAHRRDCFVYPCR